MAHGWAIFFNTRSFLFAAQIKSEPTDKPGSVVGNHSSGSAVTDDLKRPTRRHRGPRYGLPIWSCSGWGLPSHSVLPPARCALTAPFHPYRQTHDEMPAVYFLWHFPWARAPQALPGILPCGARTFLPHQGGSDCLVDSPGHFRARPGSE